MKFGLKQLDLKTSAIARHRNVGHKTVVKAIRWVENSES